MSSAQARVIKFLRTEPGNRSRIATIEVMADVSQPTIYRMVERGVLGKVDGVSEVYLKEPITIKGAEKVVRVKGGFTDADRVAAAGVTAKVDQLVNQNNQLLQLIVALSNQPVQTTKRPVEKTTILGKYEKQVKALVKDKKLSWKKIGENVRKSFKDNPLDMVIAVICVEYALTTDKELISKLNELLDGYEV